MLCNCSIVPPPPGRLRASCGELWAVLGGIRSVKAVSVPHDTHSLLCSGSVQCTYCLRENAEKSWELWVKMQYNWAAFQTTSLPESAYGAWSEMMHSLQHSLSVALRAFLNFWVGPWNSWFCHCIVTAAVQFSRKNLFFCCDPVCLTDLSSAHKQQPGFFCCCSRRSRVFCVNCGSERSPGRL